MLNNARPIPTGPKTVEMNIDYATTVPELILLGQSL
jgi:hypothetical protein